MVFSAGRMWDEAKNLAALDRAAGRTSWPVYVAGDDRHPDGASGPDASNVTRLGRLDQSQVAAIASLAAIYALPARYEPFGLSILEAALCGCALVLGDIPSLREIWGDCACYVPPNDSDALAQAIERLIASERERTMFASRSLARAREFTPERMGAAYLRAYRRLAGRHAHSKATPPARAAHLGRRVACES
jgi:glycosyltransferase involved in cell wall biosynthesis